MKKTQLPNPLDSFFQTAPVVEREEVICADIKAPPTEKIQNVYTSAMEVFRNQIELVQMIDPKYAARNAEVAAQFLKIALDAANAEAKSAQEPSARTVNNNLIVTDRNELLKQLLNGQK